MNKWWQILKGLIIITILVVIGIALWWFFTTYPNLLIIILTVTVILLSLYIVYLIGTNIYHIFEDWFGNPPATT